jgi:hypothetical protein
MEQVGESKAEAKAAVEEMFEALPKSKKLEFLGHLNEMLLYIGGHSTPDPKK